MKIEYKLCCGEVPTRDIYALAFHDPGFSLRCRHCFTRVSVPIDTEPCKLANAWNALANGRQS
jgi:hypothetical protein